MAKRSLQASPEGIKQAKQAFKRKGWTQEYLAAEVGLESRQPIWKFFTGRPVDRHVFIEICFVLDLVPEDIAIPPDGDELSGEQKPAREIADLDELVKKVRSQHSEKIQHQCGTLQMLDISRPIELDDIYVDVNILEEITHQRWLDISELQAREFDKFGWSQDGGNHATYGYPVSCRPAIRLGGLQAVESHYHLIVLGKPGAGKTTFLQAIALQCDRGNFQSHCVPLFIRLKNFAEDAKDDSQVSLLRYLYQQLASCDISQEGVETLLEHGRILLLLDGLDEVPPDRIEEITKQLRQFAERYYKNYLTISCRPAAYQYRFTGFTEVEIADFTPEQIAAFVRKWFVSVARNSAEEGLALATEFMEQLKRPENRQIRELAGTPILLNLTCLVFQARANFPILRAKLYQQGLDILLVRWDETRGIKRNNLYHNLSLSHKLKLLSQLAAQTFERGEYFFDKRKLKQYIVAYLQTLPDIETTSEFFQRESEELLKSIERQHGLLVEQARDIYSFSHLTFQEYLTSRYLVYNCQQDTLDTLADRIKELRWREVFLLTSGMLANASDFLRLMRQKIKGIVAKDGELLSFLSWTDQKSKAISQEKCWVGTRSFLLTASLGLCRIKKPQKKSAITLASTLVRELNLDLDLQRIVNSQSDLDLEMARLMAQDLLVNWSREIENTIAIGGSQKQVLAVTLKQELEAIIERVFDPELERSLRLLYTQLPTSLTKKWWTTEGEVWTEQLRTIMTLQKTIAYDWKLSDRQQETLQQFYNANRLLASCLETAAGVTPSIRAELERTLLLP